MKLPTTVSGYAAKIRRLSRRIPVRDKRARANRFRQIRRAKAGLERVRAVWRVSRQEHISKSEAAKIVREIRLNALPVKRLKRHRLRQGKQLYRETFARRGSKQVLKGTYYRLGRGRQAIGNFADALRTEQGRVKSVAPAGRLAAYRLIGRTKNGEWLSSTNIAMDTPVRDSMAAFTRQAMNAGKGKSDSIFDFLLDEDFDGDFDERSFTDSGTGTNFSVLTSVDVQFIYSG